MMNSKDQALYDIACNYERSVADLHFKTFAKMLRENLEARYRLEIKKAQYNYNRDVTDEEEIKQILYLLPNEEYELTSYVTSTRNSDGYITTEVYKHLGVEYTLYFDEDDEVYEIKVRENLPSIFGSIGDRESIG